MSLTSFVSDTDLVELDAIETMETAVLGVIADAGEQPATTKPAKLSPSEKKAKAEADERAAKEADRKALQTLVPWKIVENDWEQRGAINIYFDEQGHFPRVFRAYTREEWREAIKVLAGAVAGLGETNPEYQRRTGIYVEEQGDDLLLICTTRWQLLIQVPAKASTSGKRFELKPASGVDNYSFGGETGRLAAFAELVTDHLPPENRELLLDICCQYLRQVRIHVNRATWAAEHPDLAHLLTPSR